MAFLLPFLAAFILGWMDLPVRGVWGVCDFGFLLLSEPMSKQLVMQLKSRARKRSVAEKTAKLSDNEVAASFCKAKDTFLRSPEWKEAARITLSRYGWTCMCCGSLPKTRHGVNVDHIKPRKLYPELALDLRNLQVLCARCNKRKGNTVLDYRPITLA